MRVHHRFSVGGVASALVVVAGADSTSTTTATTTTYPTTVTSLWSTTITTFATAAAGASSPIPAPDTWITVRTVTLLDPWPVSPDPYLYPYTILETSIVKDTVVHGASTTTTASTAYPTWLVWDTQGADLPVGNVPQCAKTDTGGQCAPPAWKPDTRCLALGQETRCRAQCTIRNWQWWCEKAPPDRDSVGGPVPVGMGRLCWGGAGNYTQLVEPCDDTDYPPECAPCPTTTA